MIRKAGDNNYARRLGTEAEVACAVLFLLSDGAAYITGDTLRYVRRNGGIDRAAHMHRSSELSVRENRITSG